MLTTLKRRVKYACYRRRGSFPYFGETLYFPNDSLVFSLACAQGIYEHDSLRLLQCAAKPHGWYFDVGANIGLMSAPLLQSEPSLHVVSVEASPGTAAFLARSAAESPNKDRWHVVAKGFGASPGKATFHASPVAGGAFDGLQDTGRISGVSPVEIELTTLDHVWIEHGRPPVCVVKIDVEGGEAQVLLGARECLAAARPIILLECFALNLAAYGQTPGTIFELARELDYDVLSCPGLAPILSARSLLFHCSVNDNIILIPRA